MKIVITGDPRDPCLIALGFSAQFSPHKLNTGSAREHRFPSGHAAF